MSRYGLKQSGMTRILASGVLVGLASSAGAVTLGDLPKGAHAGDCFNKVVTPAAYHTVRESISAPPIIHYRDIPAVYRTEDRRILVSPGRVDHETIPAVTGVRTRYVEHPGPDRLAQSPAVYRYEYRRVLVRPARLEWRSGRSAQGYDESGGEGVMVRPTGEVMCRVRVPAEYALRRVRVLVAPARTCIVKGRAVREKVVERVVIKPARVVDHPVAPVYRTESQRILVAPARRVRVETPAPVRYQIRRVLDRPASTRWAHILCRTPAAHQALPTISYGAPAPQSQSDYAPARPSDDVYRAPQPPTYHAPMAPQGYGAPRR